MVHGIDTFVVVDVQKMSLIADLPTTARQLQPCMLIRIYLQLQIILLEKKSKSANQTEYDPFKNSTTRKDGVNLD